MNSAHSCSILHCRGTCGTTSTYNVSSSLPLTPLQGLASDRKIVSLFLNNESKQNEIEANILSSLTDVIKAVEQLKHRRRVAQDLRLTRMTTAGLAAHESDCSIREFTSVLEDDIYLRYCSERRDHRINHAIFQTTRDVNSLLHLYSQSDVATRWNTVKLSELLVDDVSLPPPLPQALHVPSRKEQEEENLSDADVVPCTPDHHVSVSDAFYTTTSPCYSGRAVPPVCPLAKCFTRGDVDISSTAPPPPPAPRRRGRSRRSFSAPKRIRF
jgi:hypothetical protein